MSNQQINYEFELSNNNIDSIEIMNSLVRTTKLICLKINLLEYDKNSLKVRYKHKEFNKYHYQHFLEDLNNQLKYYNKLYNKVVKIRLSMK